MAPKAPQMSPIFSRIPAGGLAPAAALNQVARDQAAAAQAVARYQAARARPGVRMAGGTAAVNPIFNRLRAGIPFVGPAITTGVGAYRVAQGEPATFVAADTALDTGLSALGGGIGTVLGGPFGTAIGAAAAPIAFRAAVGNLKPVDMSGISAAEGAQMAGTPAFGGLTVPVYDVPGIPDVVTPALGNIDWTRARQVTERETVAEQPVRDGSVPPAVRRPEQEARPPISREVSIATSQSPQQQARQKENALAQMYATQEVKGREMAKGGELQRRLWESGEMRGMTPETFMSWVEANPGVAYREALKRGLLAS